LFAALHHADPGFLEDILGELAMAGKKDEIAQQAMLVALDQTVEEIRVASTQTTGDLNVLS
jgi:hypothetical protein